MFCYPDPDRRYSTALASIVYDVLDDYIVHASLHECLASERAAATEHLAQLEDLNIYQDSISIFDRGYYSEHMFRYCVDHGHLCLMRLKEGYKILKSCNGDTVTVLPGKPEEHTQDIRIRVVEVILDNGTKEYLATNIFDEKITKAMFRELYFYRWPVELKYKELKSRLALEEFNGASVIAVFQEFFINLLLSNISSLVKNEADDRIDEKARPSNKHRYQANRSFIIGRMKKVIPSILVGMAGLEEIDYLLKEAIRCRSQIQPGRSFRRKRSNTKGRRHFRNRKVAF